MEAQDWSDDTLPKWWRRTRLITMVWLATLLLSLLVVSTVVYALAAQGLADNAPAYP